jgi:hypothetical protein
VPTPYEYQKTQGNTLSRNLTTASDSPLLLFDLPLGKYRFDTSIQLDQVDQKKISPLDTDTGLKQKTFFLQFSIRW